MSHAELQRLKRAQSVPLDEAESIIRADLKSGCAVQSFTSETGTEPESVTRVLIDAAVEASQAIPYS